MAVSDLNIRLGVLYRDFDRSMRQVENRLRQSAQTIGNIGDSMTTALTVPLLGIGAMAIKAAGDFEALKLAMQTTMQNAGYSTQQMTAELEALRKVALAPGIDLEQAVKGSIRLQSVGFSAERARKTLVELANAIAAAGGSAENLDSVSIQFAQMSAKGVVMASDLRIIQEAMPGVSKAMKDAFGVTTAEGIRDAGISADQFIDGVTQQLAKNTRVQGGIKNAIDNTRSAFVQFFAAIGDGINEAVNLNEVAEDVSKKLNAIASAFKNLDPETKKSIISFALYAAAAGPVIKAFSLLYSGAATVVSGFRFIGGALSSASSAVLGFADKFSKMNMIMKASTVGVAIAAIGALYLAYNSLNDSITKAMHTTIALNEIEKTANDSVAQQKVEVETLIGVLKSETTARGDKLAAIKKLNEISPEYFKNLQLEGDKVVGITESYDGYINNLLRAARVKAAESKLIEIDKKKIELADQLARQEAQRASNYRAATGGMGSSVAFEQQAIGVKQQLVDEIKREISAVGSEEEAIRKVIQANLDLTPPMQKVVSNKGAATEETKKSKKAIQEETDALKELQEVMYILGNMPAEAEQKKKSDFKKAVGLGEDTAPAQAPDTSELNTPAGRFDAIAAEAKGLGELGAAMDVNKDKINAMSEAYMSWGVATTGAAAAFEALTATFAAGGAAQSAIWDSVGASIQQNTDAGVTSMKVFAREAISSALKTAKAYAVQGIFAAVKGALTNVPFPLNLIAAGGAAALAGALFNGLTNRITAPKLAKGGLAYGPTMAMVGDNAGASVDPEVIAPLSKLKGIIGAASGSQHITGNFKVSGYDLVLALEKNQRRNTRTR